MEYLYVSITTYLGSRKEAVMFCKYCSEIVPSARFRAGYKYCMDSYCVSKDIKTRQDKYRLILLPRQGFNYVPKDSTRSVYSRSDM